MQTQNGIVHCLWICLNALYYSWILDTVTPWRWRCLTHCGFTKSFITPNCFLNATKKFYNVFIAMYMWVMEYPVKIIIRESELSAPTIRALEFHWREVMMLENDNIEQLQGPLGGEKVIVEADETAIGKTKKIKGHNGKRQRSGGPQWLQTMVQVICFYF